MLQLYGEKVMDFTTRGLTDVRKLISEARRKTYREKSADAIVANYVIICEGLNFNT